MQVKFILFDNTQFSRGIWYIKDAMKINVSKKSNSNAVVFNV